MNQKLIAWPSGRPRTWDDLLALQGQIETIAETYAGLGAFILSGCEVTQNAGLYNIAPGVVFIDGKLARFEGAANIDVPCHMGLAAPVYSDPRKDTGGNFHNALVETKAVLDEMGAFGSNEHIVIDYGPNKSFWDVVKEKTNFAAKANVQQAAWQNLTLQNGATNDLTGVYYSASYHKDTLGFVRLRGLVEFDETVANAVISVLPVGYRPAKTLHYNYKGFDLEIHPNGNIEIINPSIPLPVAGRSLYILENIPSFLPEA